MNAPNETHSAQWRMSHLLFILNNANGAEQEIECEVKVCHAALGGSACQAAAGNCLHCKHGRECGPNGTCRENAMFTGYDCECDAGFTGNLCEIALYPELCVTLEDASNGIFHC